MIPDEIIPVFKLNSLNDPTVLEALFIFCLIWSIGAAVHENERSNIDTYIRELSGLPMKSGITTTDNIPAAQLPGGMITSAAPSGIGS